MRRSGSDHRVPLLAPAEVLACQLEDAADVAEPNRLTLLLDESLDVELPLAPVKRARRTYKPVALAFSLIGCLIVSLVPLWTQEPDPSTRASAKRGMALFVFAACMYGTEALPAWVVSLAMFPLSTAIQLPPKTSDLFALSVTELERASLRAQYNLDGLANQVNFLVLGSLTLAAAMNKYSLDTRIATAVLSRAGRAGPRTLTLAVMLVGFFLSWIVGNACSAVALLLIITPLLRACPRETNFPQLLVSCIAFGGNLGGMATPTSSGQNAAALSILTSSLYECSIGFPSWIAVTLPTNMVLLMATWAMLLAYWRPTLTELPQIEMADLGPMDASSIGVSVIVALTVGAWAASSALERYLGDLGIISLLPMLLRA
jgi:di/tricarboxylate transporter